MSAMPSKPAPRGRRLLKRTLLGLGALLLAAVLALAILFQGEFRTLRSIRRVGDTSLFTMEYKGDYGFDQFLKTGASSDSQLVAFITKRLLKGFPMEFDLPDLGCSTFAAASPDGDALFGRNFDMYDSPALFVKTRPKNGYASLSMVNLAYIGFGQDKLPLTMKDSIFALAAPYVPLDGVNEKGLAVGVLLIDTQPTNQQTEKIDITTTTAIRLMLDKAATVEEALELLGQYDMHSSANSCYHFQIADRTGRAVVAEYIGDRLNIVESPCATNFLLTEGDWDFGAGQDRFAILEQTLEQRGGIFTEQQAMDLLKAVKQVPRPEKDSSTQWSCVYNQTRGSVDIAMDMDYDRIYSFSLAD